MYFALLLDRKTAGPVMIGCGEVGGKGGGWGHPAERRHPRVCRHSRLAAAGLLLLLLPLPVTTLPCCRAAPLLHPPQGGTSIEELAEKFPDKIVKIPIDIRQGITDAQAQQARWPVLQRASRGVAGLPRPDSVAA